MPLLGAHQSIAGGLHLAFERINEVGGESLQIFTANQRQWRAVQLQAEDVRLFKERWRQSGKMPVASHASYLINLAASDPEKAVKSVAAFVEELQRCQQLGIPFVVIHPGSHGGAGIEAGLVEVARNLDLALEHSGGLDANLKILLETTAGQGTSLGSRFEELGWLLGQSRYPDLPHLGVCVDTCHIHHFCRRLRHICERCSEGMSRPLPSWIEKRLLIGCRHIQFFHLQ
jgi:deoxyribonuclease IV